MKIYTEAPHDFIPDVEVAANYCLFENKLLLLHRSEHCKEPHTWGVPAGKLEPGEKPLDAAVRELFEETGIIGNKKNYLPIRTLYIEKPDAHFLYHMYYLPFSTEPILQLSPREVLDAKWVTLKEVRQLPLITGGEGALIHCENFLKINGYSF